jgi:ArsR family transcriptional regulator
VAELNLPEIFKWILRLFGELMTPIACDRQIKIIQFSFVSANILTDEPEIQALSTLFTTIGQTTRLQILFAIGKNEACVCHLEAVLGMRQATISQHLMMMRQAKIVETHKVGRHVYYRLVRPELVDLCLQAAALMGISEDKAMSVYQKSVPNCNCPRCSRSRAEDLPDDGPFYSSKTAAVSHAGC